MKCAEDLLYEARVTQGKAMRERGMTYDNAREYALHMTALRHGVPLAYCPEWIKDEYMKELKEKSKMPREE